MKTALEQGRDEPIYKAKRKYQRQDKHPEEQEEFKSKEDWRKKGQFPRTASHLGADRFTKKPAGIYPKLPHTQSKLKRPDSRNAKTPSSSPQKTESYSTDSPPAKKMDTHPSPQSKVVHKKNGDKVSTSDDQDLEGQPVDLSDITRNLTQVEVANLLSDKGAFIDVMILQKFQDLEKAEAHNLSPFQIIARNSLTDEFNKANGEFVQMVHLSKGHYVVLSNIFVPDEEKESKVHVYDSMMTYNSDSVGDIAHMAACLLRSKNEKIIVDYQHVAQQGHLNSCGAYACANAALLIRRMEPVDYQWPDDMTLRTTLFQCINQVTSVIQLSFYYRNILYRFVYNPRVCMLFVNVYYPKTSSQLEGVICEYNFKN